MTIWSAEDWSYRITATRTILVKNKNAKNQRILAEDTRTKLLVTIDVSDNASFKTLRIGKEYTVELKIYTSKSTENVDKTFVELFEVLDVDQPVESFLNALCTYPNLVRIELEEIENE